MRKPKLRAKLPGSQVVMRLRYQFSIEEATENALLSATSG